MVDVVVVEVVVVVDVVVLVVVVVVDVVVVVTHTSVAESQTNPESQAQSICPKQVSERRPHGSPSSPNCSSWQVRGVQQKGSTEMPMSPSSGIAQTSPCAQQT
ncbi:MAG: hypothetical protein IT335_03480 [Thermomicrobiales bacterium]|nr:hypothetical protein [Thermomicrobiales bacterium]